MVEFLSEILNIMYDRCFLFTLKQQKVKAVELFNGRLKEQAEKWRLGGEEDFII